MDPAFHNPSSASGKTAAHLPTLSAGSAPFQRPNLVLDAIAAFQQVHPGSKSLDQVISNFQHIHQRFIQSGRGEDFQRISLEGAARSDNPLLRSQVAAMLSDALLDTLVGDERQKTLDSMYVAARKGLDQQLQMLHEDLRVLRGEHLLSRVRCFLRQFCSAESGVSDQLAHRLIESGGVLGDQDKERMLSALMAHILKREPIVRQNSVVFLIADLMSGEIIPRSEAISEIESFCQSAPRFFLRAIAREQSASVTLPPDDYRSQDTWANQLMSDLGHAALWYVLEKRMPMYVAERFVEVIAGLGRQGKLDDMTALWGHFARHSLCYTEPDHDRLPEPIGRPAFLGALKENGESQKRFGSTNRNPGFELLAHVPEDPVVWRYFGQRIEALARIHSPRERDDRLVKYLNSFREACAAQSFYKLEERFFREVNLDGVNSPQSREFYKEQYGVDNAPGMPGTEEPERALAETARAFRLIAAARYELNVRKGYASSFDGAPWLLRQMAEALKGETQLFRVADPNAYPGPGIRLSGLKLKNAFDFSTPQATRTYFKHCPWLGSYLRGGRDVEFYLFRGFSLITRSLEAGGRPMPDYWRDRASFEGEAYSAIIFNDHFHNDRLPEARMWLVPEHVLHRKLAFAIEDRVDVNRLDLTPEGIAEECAASGRIIFDVGSSCVRWGSFANAWPFGEGESHEFERSAHWQESPWQSPRHVHRALAQEEYYRTLTPAVAEVLRKALDEHDGLKDKVNFFLDLHSSFLSMEEAWAKDYVNSEESPATLEDSATDSKEQKASADGSNSDDRNSRAPEQLDMQVRRSRTRMLEHFLTIRNQMVRSGKDLEPRDFPILELQYTRLFARQAGTVFITGSDMALRFPNSGQPKQYLFPSLKRIGGILRHEVGMTEQLEFAWVKHFVEEFALNNCPRIIVP